MILILIHGRGKKTKVVLCCSLLVARLLGAQTGLLIVAHGADSNWDGQVRRTVTQVRRTNGPVRIAFLMGPEAERASFESQARELASHGARRIAVVPLLVSSSGGHYEDIVRAAHSSRDTGMNMHGENPAHGVTDPIGVPMRVTSAMDAAPELG
jgi:sirohydrochlorin ferrochelatase